MKQNNFYEVDGCTDFIPVTINETFANSVAVTVDNYMQGYGLVVKEVYRFPKGHEPQKPVVPKFVAKWLEGCKRYDWHLQKVLSRLDDDEKIGDWAYDENDDLISEKVDMIARAWVDGYEIEKEKLYTVDIGGVGSSRLFKHIRNNKYRFHWRKELEGYTDKLTEQEIKKADERLWEFAKEVEDK